MFSTKCKSFNENKVDLKEKTLGQLQELLERQSKILKNIRFLDTLPDKGEKVKNFLNLVEIEIEKRREHDKLCEDLAVLNIGKDQLDTLEWSGKHATYDQQSSCEQILEDDTNVLKMIASHSGVNQAKIIIKEEQPVGEPLIKPSDLMEVESSTKGNPNKEESQEFKTIERFAKNLCGRIDLHSPGKTRFVPNKPIKKPIDNNRKIAPISLRESVTLQIVQENKIKEIKSEQPARRVVAPYNFNTSSWRQPKAADFVDVLEDDDDDDDDDIADAVDNEDDND
ncbi:uncharacterized protein LOC126845517 [Adelges cooleyi]|uniref:uncharacterized protein LOC126843913 n=1 Tax=Adelges cooleyi TaxID=133065 RepID=UPI00217F7A84|nr:uncharacterized protein LOC126843913 [Adelges cooleyi]XP_050440128.1 uncharacterized protein LOC126845517 [Adelges cooleyi]